MGNLQCTLASTWRQTLQTLPRMATETLLHFSVGITTGFLPAKSNKLVSFYVYGTKRQKMTCDEGTNKTDVVVLGSVASSKKRVDAAIEKMYEMHELDKVMKV